VASLVPLLEAYMRETYGAPWHGSAERLHADALGQRCTTCVAVAPDESLAGFLAWVPSYDLHHCVTGAEALDLYVVPGWRGRGVAPQLVCAAAAEIARGGGLYLKGGAVDTGSGRRLYSRFGVCDAAGCIVGGRAFRRLAELAGRSAREILRGLPERAWNYEA
jgi:GNAT superfamily N-acetyltransferase